jgi:hypothetical protein
LVRKISLQLAIRIEALSQLSTIKCNLTTVSDPPNFTN